MPALLFAYEFSGIGRATLAGFRTGQIETALAGSPAGGFDGALAAHDNQAAGEGEVRRERVEKPI